MRSAGKALGRDEEPKRRGALVVDRDGDRWRRGNTRWTCTAPVDGVRVTRTGRLPWFALIDRYGPVRLVDANLPIPKERR